MALGAERAHVLALVVRQGLSMALVGTAIGVAGAVALSRWIEGLLFGVNADRSDRRSRPVVATLLGGRARRLLRAGVARDARRSDYGAAIRIVARADFESRSAPFGGLGRPEPVEGRIDSAAPWFAALISSSR